MWGCNCKYILSNGTSRIRPHKTEVFQDETCVYCGYYAQWVDNPDMITNTTTTSVIDKTTLSIKVYDSIVEASKATGAKESYIGNSDDFQKGVGYFPKKSKYCFVKGKITYINDDIKFRIKKETIYIYNIDGDFLGKVKSTTEASKITKDIRDTVWANLNRKTFFTKKGFVYTHNENFNVESFKEMQRQFKVQEYS